MKKVKFTDCVDIVGSSCHKFDGTKTYVSTGAVDTDHIESVDAEIVDYDGRPSRANLVAEENDILFAKMQATEKTLLIDEELSKHIYSTGFCAVRAKSDVITNKCLYYLLTSEIFLKQKDKNCSGATQKAITNAGLEKIIVSIPDLEQQTAFVQQMNVIINIIALRKTQLSKLDELIKSRFIELFGDPYINDKNWAMKTFGDICTVRQGLQIPISKRLTQYEEDCYEYITVAYLHGSKDREYIKSPKSTVVCTKDDILMTRTGNTGMVVTDVEGVFHNNFFLIDFDRTKYSKRFLVEYLNLDLIQAEIIKRAGTSTIPDLNHDQFYAISIYEPPVDLQNQFATFVEQTDKSRLAVQQSLEKLETLKKALMQQYFG